MTNWNNIKKAAEETELALRRNLKNLDDTQKALVNLNKEYGEHTSKGLTTARVTGATIPPAVYMLVQYLRGKKINPWAAGGLSFLGMMAGDLGRYKWNQHTWDKAKGEPFEKTQEKAIKAYQGAVDAVNGDIEATRKMPEFQPPVTSKGASEMNFVEKIARDVSGRYDEMLKRNADFLKKQRLAKRTVEVFAPDGKPGIMHGTQWKEASDELLPPPVKSEKRLVLIPKKNASDFDIETVYEHPSRMFTNRIVGVKCPEHGDMVLPVVKPYPNTKEASDKAKNMLEEAWKKGNLKENVKRWNEFIEEEK